MITERANLSKAWLKLEAPNRKVIPHILKVEYPMGLSLISISSLSCNDVPFTASSRLHLSWNVIPIGFGDMLYDAAEYEGSTTHNVAIHHKSFPLKIQSFNVKKRPANTSGSQDLSPAIAGKRTAEAGGVRY